jgi:hypothetical protein
MNVAAEIMSGLVLMTASISAAITICTCHGNATSQAYNIRRLELDVARLEQQRNADQQRAEVEAAKSRGYAEGVQYTATAIHTALEAVKAPQVVVQR